MRRLSLTLAATLVVAQLGSDGIPTRCWFVDGVSLKEAPALPGPYWLNRDRTMNGWLEWSPVRGKDRDAAARVVGFRNAAECDR